MKTYEYKTLTPPVAELDMQLNEHGKKGWRLFKLRAGQPGTIQVIMERERDPKI